MARLSLSLLGPFQAALDGQPVTGFESNKARALLAYLAVEADCAQSRDALAGLLWPDQPNQTARNDLRQTLANLRQAIRDRSADPPFLHISRESIQFNPASNHWLDVTEFTGLLAASERHAHRRVASCKSCAQRLQQAAELYHGNFLEQLFLSDSAAFEEWALLKREALRRLVLDALYHLTEFHERRGAYDHAYQSAARQLALDPWREEAHRQAMRALAFSGERSAALAQYETCRRILADELGAEPTEETTALYERIRAAAAGAAFAKPRGPAVSNLPTPLTPFIGREEELAQITGLLENPACRLITIAGPGGIGKTRLALQAVADQLGAFADGVCLVPLASLSSIEFIVPAIAGALDFTLSGPEDPKAQLLNYLADIDILLVLDNFEHLLDGATLVVDILQHSRQVVLLVTSRERLNVQAEWVYDLQGLRVPEADYVDAIESYSAIELFVQRAGMARVGFALSAPETLPVVRICRLTEGMPLGIELAAAWVRTLSCDQIAREIDRSLGILATTLRDVPERHRSIWAVFDHSWNLLTQEERHVFRKLAVFRGGFQREAAEQVAGATLPLLAALVDQSLLRQDAAIGRYDLHELLRQYAGEKLQEAGESEQTRKRHLEFFLTLAETTEPKLKGEQQVAWLDRLEQEHDNMRSALGWAVEHGATEYAARFAAALHPFWERRGHLHEGRHWLEVALTHRDLISTRTRARALNGAGLLAFAQGDQAQAQTRYEESLALFRTLGDDQGIANTLYRLGSVLKWRGEYVQAQALLQESLSVFRTLGDAWGVANTLTMLGIMAGEQGDIETSLSLYQESMALRRELGDQWGIAVGLNNMANILYEQGNLKQAQALHEEALALFRELGDKDSIAMSLLNLGTVMNRQGDPARAVAILKESLLARQSLGNKRGIAYCLEGLAEVASAQGRAQRAVRLCAAIEALRASIGAPWPPSERSRYTDTVTGAQAQLDVATFATAWAEGHAMTLDQAIAYALSASADPAAA